MLYSVVKDPELTAADLNHDLDTISQWAYQWNLTLTLLNRLKKFYCLAELAPSSSKLVTKVNAHKHLGLIFQSTL